MKNSKNAVQVKRKMATIFLCFFCISFQTFSQIKEKVVEVIAENIVGEGLANYQKNKLEKFASKDGPIIATIPASTRRMMGLFQEGNIVVTKSNVYFGASDFSLEGTIVIPIAGISHKQATYEGLFGIYERDAVEVTYKSETRLFVFYEEEGEWEKFKKAINKAIEMNRK
jgi:hypothetical protein